MEDWSARQYLKFEDERTRPPRDLLAQVPLERPQRVVDLGCGPGNSTELLVERYPQSEVIGLDSSPDMLRKARERLPRLKFIEADIATWSPQPGTDLLFSNAVMQWLPDHGAVLRRLMESLAPGAVLAVQMPDNTREPGLVFQGEVGRSGPWRDHPEIKAASRDDLPSVEAYYDLLKPVSSHIDIWHSVYNHVMASPQAIVEWFKGSSLQPFLSPLDAAAREKFLAAYGEKIAGAYKPRVDGKVLLRIPAPVRRGGAMKRLFLKRAAVKYFLVVFALACSFSTLPAFADAAFQMFLQSLWPQAQALGVSRATFDAATSGLEPDLSLPDLVLPGRPQKPPPGQPEFVETPADYLREPQIARLAVEGRNLYDRYRPTLDLIGRRFGVDPTIVLAIYGRETDYGRARDTRSAIRVLATQAYLGKRKDKFREEFVLALKILDAGKIRLADMKSSWAGAMGLTQFLPSDYLKYAIDIDNRGYPDIWNSLPDALASAARQLVGEGWQSGVRWAYEVHPPANVDCTLGVPQHTLPLGEWLKRGYVPAYGRTLSPAERAVPASLVQPAGLYGPSFLATANYFAIKEYNYSDLYVLFVGHLADRMLDPRPFETPWAKVAQLPTAALDRMQRILTAQGYYHDKIDGKAGMLTRSALGEYQKRSGLKLDCWPSAAVLTHMQAH